MTSDRKHITEFTLPASFQPAEFLPVRHLTRCDDARWLISTILKKTANRDIDVWGCVRLSSDILRRVMDADSCVAVIKALVAGGAIETEPHCKGVRSKGFRLAKRYLGDLCVRIRACDPRFIARIEREWERQKAADRSDLWQPVHYALNAQQAHISLAPKAHQILDSLPDQTRLCQSVLVSNIEDHRYQFSVSTTGRCFNNLTGLKRDLRSQVLIAGSAVGSVDIVNAQPALLAMMFGQQYPPCVPKQPSTYKHSVSPGVRSHANTGSSYRPAVLMGVSGLKRQRQTSESEILGRDYKNFAAAVQGGYLYEMLAKKVGCERGAVKLPFLRDVLAKKGCYPSPIEDAFAEEFPTVYRAIKFVNRDDHGCLIRELQRAESSLVIGKVAPRLLKKRCHPITLHDAVFAPIAALDDVVAAFNLSISEMGFEMPVKVNRGAA